MSKLTIEERMIKTETLLNQVLIELKELKDDWREARTSFVTLDKHVEDIAEIKKDLAEIKGKRWIQNTLSAILGAVLTVLVGYFIANIS
jgi:replicative superfamily II helicase